MTNEQIEYFGKEAARNYIEEGTDLNNTITKIAEEHALNRYEIDRIVESANTNTYLSIFSNVDDKYVEFPVADSEKVAEALHPTDEEDDYMDYDNPPIEEIEDYKEIQIFPSEDVEKTSSVRDEYSSENLQLRQRIKYAEQQLIEKMSINENAFSEETEKLYQMVKQAVLNGTRFGHIKSAMEQHSPGEFVRIFSEKTKDRLKEEDRRIDLSDSNEKLGQINPNNELLKQVDKIHAIVEEGIETEEKLASFASKVLKTTGRALKRAIPEAMRFARERPGYALGGAAVGVAGAGLFASNLAAKKKEYELSAIRAVPEKYKKR